MISVVSVFSIIQNDFLKSRPVAERPVLWISNGAARQRF